MHVPFAIALLQNGSVNTDGYAIPVTLQCDGPCDAGLLPCPDADSRVMCQVALDVMTVGLPSLMSKHARVSASVTSYVV